MALGTKGGISLALRHILSLDGKQNQKKRIRKMSFNNVTDTSPISFHEQQQQWEEKEGRRRQTREAFLVTHFFGWSSSSSLCRISHLFSRRPPENPKDVAQHKNSRRRRLWSPFEEGISNPPKKNAVRVAVNPASLSFYGEEQNTHTQGKKKELCHEMVPFTFFLVLRFCFCFFLLVVFSCCFGRISSPSLFFVCLIP